MKIKGLLGKIARHFLILGLSLSLTSCGGCSKGSSDKEVYDFMKERLKVEYHLLGGIDDTMFNKMEKKVHRIDINGDKNKEIVFYAASNLYKSGREFPNKLGFLYILTDNKNKLKIIPGSDLLINAIGEGAYRLSEIRGDIRVYGGGGGRSMSLKETYDFESKDINEDGQKDLIIKYLSEKGAAQTKLAVWHDGKDYWMRPLIDKSRIIPGKVNEIEKYDK